MWPKVFQIATMNAFTSLSLSLSLSLSPKATSLKCGHTFLANRMALLERAYCNKIVCKESQQVNFALGIYMDTNYVPVGGFARLLTCSTLGLTCLVGVGGRGACSVSSVAWSELKCISAAFLSLSRTARSSAKVTQIISSFIMHACVTVHSEYSSFAATVSLYFTILYFKATLDYKTA